MSRMPGVTNQRVDPASSHMLDLSITQSMFSAQVEERKVNIFSVARARARVFACVHACLCVCVCASHVDVCALVHACVRVCARTCRRASLQRALTWNVPGWHSQIESPLV